MIYHEVDQNSEEWDRLRLGIPTSSQFKRIVTPKGKLSTQSAGYLHRLLAEWMFGGPLEDPQSEYQSQWMERGHALEEQAVKVYEFAADLSTQAGGFVTTDNGLVGASPDRLVGNDGVLEIKCPAPATHAGYMLTGEIEDDYSPQLQGQLLITGRAWVDIVSYCPGFPTVIIRVLPDATYQAALSTALVSFVDVMLHARETLVQRYGEFPVGVAAPKSPLAPEDPGVLGVSMGDVDEILARREELERYVGGTEGEVTCQK